MDYFTLKVGDIVESLQGRDLGTAYLVVDIDKKGYCSLIDGKLKPIEKPKTKNAKHLRFVAHAPNIIEKLKTPITNCELNRLIKKFITFKE